MYFTKVHKKDFLRPVNKKKEDRDYLCGKNEVFGFPLPQIKFSNNGLYCSNKIT